MHSYYSLRYGILSPREILDFASNGGYKQVLLADVNNTTAALDFLRMSNNYPIHPAIGVDFRNGAQRCYLVIARNNKGYREINDHLSAHLHHKKPFAEKAPAFEHCFVIYPFHTAFTITEHYAFRGVSHTDLPQLRLNPPRVGEKHIAAPTMTFRNKRDFNTHRLLRAIDNNTLLSKLSLEQQASPNDLYHSVTALENLYRERPELLDDYFNMLNSCVLEFNFGTEHPHQNQQTYTDSIHHDAQLLRKLCEEGISYRYPVVTQQIRARIDKELEIIQEKGFLSYFLINWDITTYARNKGYFYVGRGSGANSVVAYILRITDVDPIELDLYFERFINLYRQNPPDFDIDFSWTDRDDVTRYIFARFRNVTLLGAYNTFQYRAVIRELGKVFGLPKHEIDRLSDGKFQMSELDELSTLVVRYSERIHDFPNSITIHAAGILITEHHIHNYVATFLPPKGFPTARFDMVISEDAGLYKFDILSQRGLGKIKDAVDMVNRRGGEQVDIHDIKRFKEDERIKHLLRNALAIGCFYVESPAMRMLMRKLRVDDYLGLVAASSVIRPGVAQSGMMREYIQRKRFPEKRQDAHPVMLDIMPETFGVMVYQEDVIKVAHYFAGLTLAEADVLRRGMSGKFRSREEFDHVKEKFFNNCIEKGYAPALATEIWRQTESFAGYAFAKGHSASYAVESYQSLFLKAYYPLEYMTATLNNGGGFYSTELYVHEARMGGADIEEPCINRGESGCVLINSTLVLGMGMIKSIDSQSINHLLRERSQNGPYTSLQDFVVRTQTSLEQVVLLVRANAFRFSGKDKKSLLWEAHLMLGHSPKKTHSKSLFQPEVKHYSLPQLYTAHFEDAFDQIELFGFPLCNPFDLVEPSRKNEVIASPTAMQTEKMAGQMICVHGYVVTAKTTRTIKGERMYFGTFIDRNGHWMDTVHFPNIATAYPFRGRGVYAITGRVVEEFGCITIEVSRMEKMPTIEDPRYAETKAFEKVLHKPQVRQESPNRR
ncbi:MAG: DNA polymerase III subunit alpha [Cryomorphaceae bacterium]|nr:DNA polymerase III subunit alpha [Cryomorphaceae bacterium]